MEPKDKLANKLAEALRTIDFDTRYYGFYQKIRQSNKSTDSALKKADWERALAATGERFHYDAREKFFASEGKAAGACSIALHVLFRNDRTTFTFAVRAPHGVTGGPFSVLAEKVGLLRDPQFKPDPPYPTLPFANPDQLLEVARFGVDIYKDAVRALSSCALCNDKS